MDLILRENENESSTECFCKDHSSNTSYCVVTLWNCLYKVYCYCLRTGLLLLLLVEGKEGDTGNLTDLESDTGNITNGVTGSAETRDEDLVVLVDVVEATIAGDEGGDLLAVLDELDTDALTDSGVGLLGLDANLLEHDALGHGGATHGVGLHGSDGVGLAVLLIPPALSAPVSSELAAGVDSLRLAHLVFSPLVSAKKMK